MELPAPLTCTIHGVYLSDRAPKECPFCGAKPADSPSTADIGTHVYGIACTWSPKDGALRCTTAFEPDVDWRAVRSRITSLTRRLLPVPDSAFGAATITRSNFVDGLTPRGMRDLAEKGTE